MSRHRAVPSAYSAVCGIQCEATNEYCGEAVSLTDQKYNEKIHRMAGMSEDVTVRMRQKSDE